MRCASVLVTLSLPAILLAGPVPPGLPAGEIDVRVPVAGSEVQVPYMHIREHLARKDFDRAEAEVSRLLKTDPTSATLQLYETEIWIARADHHYDARRFKSALELYERVFRRWSSHPHVRARFLELRAVHDLRDEPVAQPAVAQPAVVDRRSVPRMQAPVSPPAAVNVYIIDPYAQAATIDVLGALKDARSTVDALLPKTPAPGHLAEAQLRNDLRALSEKVERLTLIVAGIGALLFLGFLLLASRIRRTGG